MKNKKMIIGIIIAVAVCIVGLIVFLLTNKTEIPENAITGIPVNTTDLDLLVTEEPQLTKNKTN